jgi:hypothetical protein
MPPKRTCECTACPKCRAREEARRRYRLVAYGQWEPRGDVEQVRAHLELCRDNQLGLARISKTTGISTSTLSRIRRGVSKYVTKTVSDTILAVDPDTTVRINPVGTARRIRALVAIGWSTYAIAERLGCTQNRVWELIQERSWVAPATHDKVRALFAELCMTPGPSPISKSRAAAKGWPVPLAWDDIDNDTQPAHVARETWRDYCDDAVVDRVVNGQPRPRQLTQPEAAEVARRLAAQGISGAAMTRKYGIKADRYPQKEAS